MMITTNTLEMGGEKSQYAMEINAFYGMSFVCIHMEGYFVMYQILRKKNELRSF